MSALDRLARALLGAAARRWPAETRAERLWEWTAELHELRGRPLAALGFALSLACAPAVEDHDTAAIGWRERLPDAGRAVQIVLALLLVGGVWPLLTMRVLELASALAPSGRTSQSAATLVALTIVAVSGAWLGGRLGRLARLPQLVRSARAVAAAAAMVLLWLGKYLLQLAGDLAGDGAGRVGPSVTQLVIWAMLPVFPLLAYLVARLAMSDLRRWARPVAVLGGLAVLDAIGMVAGAAHAVGTELRLATAPLWFPLTAVHPAHAGWRMNQYAHGLFGTTSGLIDTVAQQTWPLVGMAAFGLAFSLAVARARVSSRVTPSRATVAAPIAPWASWLGAGAAVAGLLTWAVSIAFVTPAQRATLPTLHPGDQISQAEWTRLAPLEAQEMHTWLLEQQLAAILLAALGVLIFLAGRGPALLPAVSFAVVLVAGDVVLARYELGGPVAFAGAVLGGAVAFAAVVKFGAVLGGEGRTPVLRGRFWSALRCWPPCAPRRSTSAADCGATRTRSPDCRS